MSTPYRYADRPTTDDRLYLSPVETSPITAVADDGLRIDVVYRIGRPWTLHRAPRGCWTVIPVTPAQ